MSIAGEHSIKQQGISKWVISGDKTPPTNDILKGTLQTSQSSVFITYL